MRLSPRIAATVCLLFSPALTAQETVKQDLELNTFYYNSVDGKAEADNDVVVITESTRIRSGGTAPGILRYALAKDDWYFTADFYNIFISGGSWGSISLYKNGWGLTATSGFSHSKSSASIRSKSSPATSTNYSSSTSTQLAFGPAFSYITKDFRFESSLRYVLNKGNSSTFLDGYYETLKLTGYDFVIRLAKFYSLTDSVAVGTGLDFQYLVQANAEVTEDLGVRQEIEFSDISYNGIMLYPVKIQLKF